MYQAFNIFHRFQVYCTLIPDVADAVRVGVNHQHRLITVGCGSGVAKAFVEEPNGCLKLSHQYALRHEDFPPDWTSSRCSMGEVVKEIGKGIGVDEGQIDGI